MNIHRGLDDLEVAPSNVYYGAMRLVKQAAVWYPSGSSRKHITAEFIGSFLLHFVGAACTINSLDPTQNGTDWAAHHGNSGLLTAALGNGFAVAVALYITAGDNGSGGKLNPAISTGLYIAGRLRSSVFVAEVVAQILGAILGGLCVRASLPGAAYTDEVPTFRVEGQLTYSDAPRAFLWEMFLAAMLVFVYFATAIDRHNLVYTRTMFPLSIGLATAAGILAGGPYAGVGMNPARAISAAFTYWDVTGVWLYISAGVFGGILGALVHVRLFLGDTNAAMMSVGSVFEGVRQEKKQFMEQNFVQYIVVDSVRRQAADRTMFDVSGRMCYPELRNSTCSWEGVLSVDGRALMMTEKGGKFDGAVTHGYMPDTGHIAGVQSHSNGVPLANLRATLMRKRAAARVIAQMSEPERGYQHDDLVLSPLTARQFMPDQMPTAPPNTSRAHHSLV